MTGIRDVVVTPLDPYADDRGSFTEIGRFPEAAVRFEQVSHSRSRAGVLRGLHFHRNQHDLWYLANGKAQIVLVDLRDELVAHPQVETWVASADEPATILIPPRVAHGYMALTDIEMLYLTTKTWDPADEFGVRWDDPTLKIPWKSADPILSDRDRNNPPLEWSDIPGS